MGASRSSVPGFARLALVALVAAAAGCGTAAPSEPAATTSSAIQGGTDDPADDYAVAVFLSLTANSGDLCSGVLLAPNLVATARHCVQQPSSDAVDCSSTTFGALYDPGQIVVTNSPILDTAAKGHAVAKIVVPTDPGDEMLCGHDIAFLILADTISSAQYAEPAIVPALTDHTQWATTVAAIGYGLASPQDEAGLSAGTRRIRQGIGLVCIPGDTAFVDCYADPAVEARIAQAEFESGDGTCQGDSGSGAFDQTQYAAGKAVVFGVLSRGGDSQNAADCTSAVYSRFDAWGGLLVGAATEAAQMGNYALPSWATSQAAASDWGVDGGAPPPASGSGGGKGGCSLTGTHEVTGTSWRNAPWAGAGLIGLAGLASGRRARRRRTAVAPRASGDGDGVSGGGVRRS